MTEIFAGTMIRALGSHGNAWLNEDTGEAGNSRIVDTRHLSQLSIMGVVDAATDLSFWISQDGENFYFCGILSADISPSNPPGQAADFPADFHIFPSVGARYVRLQSSDNVRVTATIAAKE